MVFAKTSKSASRLSNEIREQRFEKTYLAVVENNIKNSATLKDYLIKNNKTNKVSIAKEKEGKLAILDYEVLKRKNNLSLIKINLKTGRSHQIRVQFANRGNPLYGDQKYNKNCKKNTQIALFANQVSFNHPITKKKMTFTLPLPKRYPFNLFD